VRAVATILGLGWGTADRPGRLRPGDPVSFTYRGKRVAGTVVRAARVTVAVATTEGTTFRVPPSRLTVHMEGGGDRLSGIAAQARALLARHGLGAWTFAFDQAKRRGGACHFRRREISLAVGFAEAASDAEVEDTILHEIAHALVGRRHHHDAVWQATARQIGCSAQRCHAIEFSAHPLTARCAKGCFAVGRHRRRRGMRCRRCGGAVIYEAAEQR
jgi:predicted SprT family Zn-dependent metalloprotease